MEDTDFLKVTDAYKYFGVQGEGMFGKDKTVVKAVDGVTLNLRKRAHLSIVGESGSGKSTLARLILGLERPTSGSIIFKGTEIAKKSASQLRHFRRYMQIVFQDPFASLNPAMSIGETVERPMKVLGLFEKAERRERVQQILKQVGLTDYANRFPGELSGGQRQRVAIARAISVNPELLILDEPTSALDVSIQAQIVRLLAEIQKQSDVTYILITHNIALIPYLTEQTAVMHLGKVVEMTDTATLLSNPSHPYTKQLLASAPVPDPRARKTDPRSKTGNHEG